MRYKLTLMPCVGLSIFLFSACLPQYQIVLAPTYTEIPSSIPAGLPVIVQQGQAESLLMTQTDLSKRLNIQIDTIEVISIQSAQWADGSLGCPQSGMVYAQILTPGYQIILKAANQLYEYHTDIGRSAVGCNFPVVSGQSISTPTTERPLIVIVNAKDTWINTGIHINSGQVLNISASGIVNQRSGDPEANFDANGSQYACTNEWGTCTILGARYGILIGRIGSGDFFEIGSNFKREVTTSGELFLVINDSLYSDNSGELTVTITLKP